MPGRILTRYMNLPLPKKMISGYLVIILIPLLLFGGMYVRLSTTDLIREHLSSRQSILEESHVNYAARMMQLESHHQLFQNSKPLIRYLEGYNQTASEEIYSYLTDIRPLFSYLNASVAGLQTVVYHNRQVAVPLHSDVLAIGDDTPGESELEADNGDWRLTGDHTRAYYTERLLSTDYSRVAGYLQIWIDSSEIFSAFPLSENDEMFLLEGEQWFSLEKAALTPLSAQDALTPAELNETGLRSGVYDSLIINFLHLEKLDVYVAAVVPLSEVVSLSRYTVTFLGLLLLLLVLSAMYYMIVNSLSRRLINLRYHIRNTDFDYMIPHNDVGYTDEIGDVIRAFNKMIIRIRDLISDLNIAELKKKEADFYALQAQIKPHFIYNALETIRMTAESNDDEEVADLTYSLGRFIRYNMSNGSDDSTLAREMENIENYLQIYKVSLGDRLQYSLRIAPAIREVRCPAFLLQPLVENSIHHGLSGKGKPLRIVVDARAEKDDALLSVRDDGEGIPPERLAVLSAILRGELPPSSLTRTRNGIGIVNIHQRLQSYYAEQAALEVRTPPEGGVECVLRLPCGEASGQEKGKESLDDQQ